ncbi:hypothetical protein Vretimale_7717 [Volvox reticuliferus]|uniref:Uncharacterized protein n=1 Tax=Volvox reticuliferus TaxID=1737510 RepID=A0A8J4LLU5_9CHLO|nr:hypothetical protein Vretifemale_7723 [Volvox reticuliferus]GIM02886.1 hypothetical protein Vretimale_7717 [Volvox reticuliferus]
MRGSSQTSGGSEGSFTEGALSLLRTSVAGVSNDVRKAPKPAGKAFQTAHDSSGWDRKARWQRAFNLARSKMGVQGMDESVDKWGAGGRDSDGGDLRSASAQPARRVSTLVSTGGFALAGAPGTIVELRTPVALKEHLKRGKGARELGIQLVALEGAGQDIPLSEQDAAALVAQFDQRHQMLGTAPSPGRQALTPADRALKAWMNNNANNNNNNVGGDRSCSSSSLASNTGTSCADSAASSNTGSAASQVSGSTVTASGSGVDTGMHSGASIATNTPTSPLGAVAASDRPAAIASGSSSSPAAASVGGACNNIGGFGGGSGGSVSGIGSGGSGKMLLRRYSESGGAANPCDGALSTFKRHSGAAPESIIARQAQPMQRADSASLHRPAHEASSAPRSIERQASASDEPPAIPTTAASGLQPSRGSISRQSSGVLTGAVLAMGVHPEHNGGWVTTPTTGSFDASSISGGGALRPTPRPGSAGRRAAQSQAWLTASTAEPLPPAGGIGAYADGSGSSNSGGGASSGPAVGVPSPFSSLLVSATAIVQPQAQRHMPQVLPVLQVPQLAVEDSSSPTRFLGVRNPLPISQCSAAGGGSGGVSGSEAEFANVRYLSLSPSAEGNAPSPHSHGVQLVATSPVGPVSATAAGNASSCGGSGGLVPTPPSASLDYPAAFTGGLRRPRPRVSTTGGAAVNNPSEISPPLSHGACIPADARSGVDSTMMAAAAPPSPSRLVMHTSPASPPSYSPTRAGVTAQGHRRNTTSSYSKQAGPPQSSSTPLAPRAPAQPPTSTTPSPPSPTPANINHRRMSMTGLPSTPAFQSGGSNSGNGGGGGLARPAAAASQPHSRSPPHVHRSPVQQVHHPQQLQLQPLVSTAPVWQTALKPMGAGTAPHGRLTDDGDARLNSAGCGSTSSGVRTANSPGAKVRTTPVSDAVLAGLRVVATEVADELSREAEMAAMERQTLAQRNRMRVSDSGKPRHISLPGDPWRKWG